MNLPVDLFCPTEKRLVAYPSPEFPRPVSGSDRSSKATKSAISLVLLFALLAGCSTPPRPAPPEAGAAVEQSWGSVPYYDYDASINEDLVEDLVARFQQAERDPETGKIAYRALTLSGGGSRGAYGAGVLSGWTKRGDRPEFDVVTGISTGGLLATHAYLGSKYDDMMELYKRIGNDQVFSKFSFFKYIQSTSMMDTSPLRETLSSLITDETLDLVAEEHRSGRRLFIGTSNLDAKLFTVWNMGEIANSDRPDRLKHYIDIVMASAAFPLAFPPVYVDVDGSDGPFTEMHVDGGVRETVFFFDFTDELYLAAERAGLELSDFKQELYLLNNGKLAVSSTYDPVEAGLLPIAGATVGSMMVKITSGSLFRLWVLAMADGADLHLSFIPSDFEFNSGTLDFDPEDMTRMFELGYQQSLDGTAWATQEAPANADEIVRLLSEYSYRVNRSEMPAWIKRGNE